MNTLLRRIAESGIKEDATAIERARGYAAMLDVVPSEDETRAVSDAIGIRHWVLCGIVYAYVSAVKEESAK